MPIVGSLEQHRDTTKASQDPKTLRLHGGHRMKISFRETRMKKWWNACSVCVRACACVCSGLWCALARMIHGARQNYLRFPPLLYSFQCTHFNITAGPKPANIVFGNLSHGMYDVRGIQLLRCARYMSRARLAKRCGR